VLQQARYIVYKLEQGLKDFEPAEQVQSDRSDTSMAFNLLLQFVTVIDCRGLSRRNLDFKMIKATVPVIEVSAAVSRAHDLEFPFQQNYPERQFAAYVMPVSSTVNFVWKVKYTQSSNTLSLRKTPRSVSEFVRNDHVICSSVYRCIPRRWNCLQVSTSYVFRRPVDE
jgi:hypothetical protein